MPEQTNTLLAEVAPRETGVHYNAAEGVWEMWAFGIRIAMQSALLVKQARVDVLAPWHAAAAIDGPHRDTACALVCMDRGRYVDTASWTWVRMLQGTSAVRYPVPKDNSIPDVLSTDLHEARFQTGVCWDGGTRKAEFHVALAPEIRTVYWHA